MRVNIRLAPAMLSALLAGTTIAALSVVFPADAGISRAPASGRAGHPIGHWQVTGGPPGSYRVTWTSPTALPITDARPIIYLGGRLVGPARVTATTASALVHSPIAPTAARLDVRLSGRSLDRTQPAQPRVPAQPYTVPTIRPFPHARPFTPDPGKPGDHKIVKSEYTLPATKIVGMPQKVEMVAHVVRPKDPDPSDPLVLFLHGRHYTCYTPGAKAPHSTIAASEAMSSRSKMPPWQCPAGQVPVPSYQGYEYVQNLLATQGYVTVSISADAINDLDYNDADGGAAARADLVRRHLDHWAKWVKEGKYEADMNDVFLVGHSRGGEGVARASIVIPAKAPYRISGQVLIAPTDFGRQAPAYIPTVALLGYCDGDVSDLQGQIFTDYARTDLEADDTALHSSVLLMGADHNFFNTEWTPGESQAPSNDDWGGPPTSPCGTQDPARLTAQEQQRAAKTYIAGAVQLIASGKTDLLPMFDGSDIHVKSVGRADFRTETIGAGRDLRRPGIDLSLGNSKGADTQICIGSTGDQTYCGYGASYGQVPHWINYGSGIYYEDGYEMRWTKAGGYGGMDFDTPMNLSSDTSLDLRTAVDPAVGDVQVSVRLEDGVGNTVTVTPVSDGVVPALEVGSSPLSKRWAQTLRVPLDGVKGVDLTDITGIDLLAQSNAGHVWVLDVAGVSPGLPNPPATRIAVMNMTDSSVTHRGSDAFTAKVPYQIKGDIPADGHVTIQAEAPLGTLQVTIPAGTRDGSFKIKIPASVIGTFDLHSFVIDGVMTGNYIGHLTVTRK